MATNRAFRGTEPRYMSFAGGQLEGGYGTKAGAAKNPWIKFLRAKRLAPHKITKAHVAEYHASRGRSAPAPRARRERKQKPRPKKEKPYVSRLSLAPRAKPVEPFGSDIPLSLEDEDDYDIVLPQAPLPPTQVVHYVPPVDLEFKRELAAAPPARGRKRKANEEAFEPDLGLERKKKSVSLRKEYKPSLAQQGVSKKQRGAISNFTDFYTNVLTASQRSRMDKGFLGKLGPKSIQKALDVGSSVVQSQGYQLGDVLDEAEFQAFLKACVAVAQDNGVRFDGSGLRKKRKGKGMFTEIPGRVLGNQYQA